MPCCTQQTAQLLLRHDTQALIQQLEPLVEEGSDDSRLKANQGTPRETAVDRQKNLNTLVLNQQG